MIDQNWVFLAVAINLVGAFVYAYSVAKGNTRPNRVIWFILSLAPLFAFAALMLQSVSFRESVFTLERGISPLIILTSTLLHNGDGAAGSLQSEPELACDTCI
jgi:hypothetical protein